MIGLVVALALQTAPAAANQAGRPLVVCADPNNLPFSNERREGFENKVAELVARDLGRPIEWVWWAQRRGYVRNTLKEGHCDLWPGVAAGVEMVSTTTPYYRSTYEFVTRADRPLAGLILDDPRLRTLKIGVQMVGDDAMNTPPAHAMAARGLIGNVRGYMLYGDYTKPNPPSAIVKAVEKGAVDVAIVWGPLAGYFARRSPVPLRLDRVTPSLDHGQWPMAYDISMGVRRTEPELQRRIDTILQQEQPAIRAILAGYGVPVDHAD